MSDASRRKKEEEQLKNAEAKTCEAACGMKSRGMRRWWRRRRRRRRKRRRRHSSTSSRREKKVSVRRISLWGRIRVHRRYANSSRSRSAAWSSTGCFKFLLSLLPPHPLSHSPLLPTPTHAPRPRAAPACAPRPSPQPGFCCCSRGMNISPQSNLRRMRIRYHNLFECGSQWL
jgi:hypothetical protein